MKFGNAAAFDPILLLHLPSGNDRLVVWSAVERGRETNRTRGVGVRDGSRWLAVPLFV